MKQALLQAVRSLRLRRRLHSPFWEGEMRRFGVYTNDFAEDKATGNLKLLALGATLPRSRAALLVTYFEAKHIGDACRFYNSADGDLYAEMAGLRFRIDASGEFAMLVEILQRGYYDFQAERPVAVWDIGMNAGYAALAFARRENVVKIVGYEPFRRTFEAAEFNFALNPQFRDKIHPVQKGVGAKSERLPALYRHDFRESNSIFEDVPSPDPGITEEVVIQSAPDALDQVLAESGGLPLVCKIDAEGAEYVLLPALAEAHRLEEIGAFVIEYTRRDDDTLPRLLRDAGFRVTRFLPLQSPLAFLYAERPPLTGLFDGNAGLTEARASGEACAY